MKKLLMAAAMTLAFAGQAAAGPYTTPSNNNILGQVQGYLGANLYLVGGPANITVEFLGKEAGWTNTFTFETISYTTTGPTQVGPTVVNLGTLMNVPSGLLNFSFSTSGAVVPNSVQNGANVLPNANASLTKPNFFVSLGNGAGFVGNAPAGPNPTFGTVAILAFDDSGAGSDDNHDDLVIRLSLSGGSFSVPDGGTTLMLLGGALMGLGALRRKFAL